VTSIYAVSAVLKQFSNSLCEFKPSITKILKMLVRVNIKASPQVSFCQNYWKLID